MYHDPMTLRNQKPRSAIKQNFQKNWDIYLLEASSRLTQKSATVASFSPWMHMSRVKLGQALVARMGWRRNYGPSTRMG